MEKRPTTNQNNTFDNKERSSIQKIPTSAALSIRCARRATKAMRPVKMQRDALSRLESSLYGNLWKLPRYKEYKV